MNITNQQILFILGLSLSTGLTAIALATSLYKFNKSIT